MTISTTQANVTVAGNGATTTFSFPFVAAAASDIEVTYTDATGTATVLNPSQYTLYINAAAAGQIWGVGGTVTYPVTGSPIAVGTSLTITRIVPLTQLISISNQGNFYPAAVEQAIDTICLEVQQVSTTANEAIRINPADTALANPLPIASQRANQLLGFDSTGQPIAASPSSALVSSAMQPVVDSATKAAALALLGASGASPSLTIVPTANATIPTLTSFNVQGTTTSATEREFQTAIGFTINQGSGATGGNQDKVALYVGADVQSGAGDAWSMNTVLTMEAGSGTNNNQGWELDFNNLNADRGDTAAGGGLSAPVAYGMSITGSSTFKSTAALLISGTANVQWNRGIVMNNSVVQASFQDLSNATTVFDIYGSHTYGLDMSQAAITSPIRIANGGIITARNAANNADVPMLQLDSSNVLHIGGAGLSTVNIYSGNFLPGFDNSYSLGITGQRWSVVWAVNGTIQTSDPSQKKDIAPLPSMLGLIGKLNPVTFKWKVGGIEGVDKTERQTVQDVEIHEWDEDVVEMRDGVAVLTKVHRTKEMPVFDLVPVMDQFGKPAIDHIEAKPAIVDPNGVVLRPAQPARDAPRMHHAPRMVEKDVTVRVPVEREGRRTHWGFLAPEVRDAFAEIGMDFGGYVKDEDGTHGLRPDQFIPVLVKCIQELASKVAALEAAR